MSSLHFEKISQFDRLHEPVTVSIPFAQNTLMNAAHFTITDADTVLPTQVQPLAYWPDSSIKWLLVSFQPDLPGNAAKNFTFGISDTPVEIVPDQTVTVTETDGKVAVDTGPLQFTITSDGFLPITDIQLNERALWQQSVFDGFQLVVNENKHNTATPITWTIVESGPLRAVIEISGTHYASEHNGALDFAGRITAYAGKPYIEVEYQFINRLQQVESVVNALSLKFRPPSTETPQLALGQGYYRTTIEQGTEPLSMSLTTDTLLYQANEHYVASFYGDFWADWRDSNGGLAISIHQAHQNFPKKLTVNHDGIDCDLYPADEQPARFLRGMAKTHRIMLHFHDAQLPVEEISTRSLQFQLPDHPTLSRDWYRENNPWRETFFPEKLPGKLISSFSILHDSRPEAVGMFHFGDAPDVHYTDQGRGNGETVWVNNEYDRTHACTLFWALTGQRRVYDSAITAARHWVDVDFCHYDPDPLINGGLRIHDVYHATGKVIPSHQWVEGFLDYYFLTGRQEALAAANSVAENVLRCLDQPEMREPGATSVREGGWALRAMVGMFIGTGEERWRIEAKRIVERFLTWMDTYQSLLAPYTSHSMPRVTFMISLTVNSFARYLLIEDDERVKKLIISAIDDIIANNIGPDGIFYYKELPSLRRHAPTAHALEALTHAFRITGDDRYLKIAARQFAALAPGLGEKTSTKKYVDGSGAVVRGVGGGRVFSDKYISILLFAAEATKEGLLDWYEYPFQNI